MKRFIFIIPLIVLSVLMLAFEQQQSNLINKTHEKKESIYFSHESKKLSADYFIDVELNTEQKKLIAMERIVWRNFTKNPTSELHFHLYANAFSNNKTELSKRSSFQVDEQTKVEISTLIVDGQPREFIYFQPEVENKFDSTVAKIILDERINPGDSTIIEIEYELNIPKSKIRFGYASGREFYFIAQWFPKLGVFKNGEWTCSQYHPFTEFYSDFANYDIAITTPSNFIVGTTGRQIGIEENQTGKIIHYSAKKVIDFAWTASPEFQVLTEQYKSKFGKDIEITFLLQPENFDLKERKLAAARNTIKFLEDNIGEFPYSNITLVDVPRSSNLGGMEYPGIVTYFTPLFTPIELQKPEATIVHELVHQYFYASVSNNEVYEGWLDEGITTYLEGKILLEFYGKPKLSFGFIDYYPIFGLKFLSFREIPLIYTLRSFETDTYAYSLANYYINNNLGDLQTKSYLLPTYRSAMANIYSKPTLAFQTLEKYIGLNELLKIFSRYYESHKFSLVGSAALINKIKDYENSDLTWFVNNFIESDNRFDYKVSSVYQVNDTTYKIFVERLEEGVTPTEIAIYTETDTTFINWNGEERWKEFLINSKSAVIAAEVDPHYKNIMDLNYANNSFTVEQKYWASLSIAIRWFFWIQNTLLLFGSLG